MFFLSMKVLLGFLGGYVITSFILFKKPSLIHKKKRQYFVAKHISHRGGAGEAYENTIVAFRRAANIRTDMLELDCHLTKDNQVVVSHDSSLKRATGLNKKISEIEYKDLPLLLQAIPIDFEPGKEYSGHASEEYRKIPLLSDVFREFPNMPINIDIKVNDDRLIKEVDALVRHYHREHLTVWGNFSDTITSKCYAQNSNTGLLFSIRRVVVLMILFYTGLLPFVPIKESFLEIFLPSLFLRRHVTEDSTSNGLLPSIALRLMDAILLRKSLFNHLQKRGIQVYIWVLNNEEEYARAFELGVTGVMTDYPNKLRQFLDKHTEYDQVVP